MLVLKISKLLLARPSSSLSRLFSSKVVSIPFPQALNTRHDENHPSKFNRDPNELVRMNRTGAESIYKLGKHRSNAMEMIHLVPPVEVDGDMAVCDGGGGALGHPLEYISLERPGAVEYCKYCSLRYTRKIKK